MLSRASCDYYPTANGGKPRRIWKMFLPLRWRHNGHDGVSNHQPHHCLLNRLFGCRSKQTLKLRVTGLCAGNSLVTGEFPAQRASNAENVSIWWRHHVNEPRHSTANRAHNHWDDVYSALSIYRGHFSLKNSRRHPISCPWGRRMGCRPWVYSLT